MTIVLLNVEKHTLWRRAEGMKWIKAEVVGVNSPVRWKLIWSESPLDQQPVWTSLKSSPSWAWVRAWLDRRPGCALDWAWTWLDRWSSRPLDQLQIGPHTPPSKLHGVGFDKSWKIGNISKSTVFHLQLIEQIKLLDDMTCAVQHSWFRSRILIKVLITKGPRILMQNLEFRIWIQDPGSRSLISSCHTTWPVWRNTIDFRRDL